MAKGLITGAPTKGLLGIIPSSFQGSSMFLKQQSCPYCHPEYPAMDYQKFNYCPHCGRFLKTNKWNQ